MVILFLAGVATAAGVRFHPEVISEYGWFPGTTFLRLNLKNGSYAAGRLMKETSDGVQLKVGSSSILFPKSEIFGRQILSREEIKSEEYAAWFKSQNKRPLFTRRYKDSLLPVFKETSAEILAKTLSKMAEKGEQMASDSGKKVMETIRKQ